MGPLIDVIKSDSVCATLLQNECVLKISRSWLFCKYCSSCGDAMGFTDRRKIFREFVGYLPVHFTFVVFTDDSQFV